MAYLSKKEIEMILKNRVAEFNSIITRLYLKDSELNFSNGLESSIGETSKLLDKVIEDLGEIEELFKAQWSGYHFEVTKQE